MSNLAHNDCVEKRLQDAVTCFASLTKESALPQDALYNRVIRGIFDVCSSILDCEKAGIDVARIHEVVLPARRIHSDSPLCRRFQEWPRGYPGDFETIEYICRSENKAPVGSVAYHVEQTCLNSALAQQHRNKVYQQSQFILDAFTCRETPKILSLACGSSPDLASVQPFIRKREATIFLNDLDADAIAFSHTRLSDIAHQCEYIHGDALKTVRRFTQSGNMDLVMAGGLFDYLTDRQIIFLLRQIYHRLLNTGGRFVFTNIADGNPHRVWMQYIVDWTLIERSRKDILAVCRDADIPENGIEIRRDLTGLTYLIDIVKV